MAPGAADVHRVLQGGQTHPVQDASVQMAAELSMLQPPEPEPRTKRHVTLRFFLQQFLQHLGRSLVGGDETVRLGGLRLRER